jgi:polyhydroxybutyrate depolymerase
MEDNTQFSKKADNLNFIVAYPESYRFDSLGTDVTMSWNAGNLYSLPISLGIDDVGFINKLLDKLVGKFRIDTTRIYISGLSAGGMMTYRLACELSHRIAAIGCVSTSMVFDHCNPKYPIPIIHLHSTLDQNIPFQGGTGGSGGYNFNSLDSTHLKWINLLKCTDPNNIVYQSNLGQFTKSTNCTCNTELHYYLTRDGGNDGHTWFENPSSVLDATEMLLAFFSKYTKSNCILNKSINFLNLKEIEIYPNPTSNDVLIDGKDINSSDLYISVYDSSGSLVAWIKPDHFPYQLKTEAYLSGEYLFRLSVGENSVVKKVIIFK